MNKKPKRPKVSASSKSWESYDQKMKDYNKANKTKTEIMKRYSK